MVTEQSIELDCAPGDPRPGDLIAGVIADTDLILKDPVSKFFGCWKWDYSEVDHLHWELIKPILKERITALYNDNIIRYGSW